MSDDFLEDIKQLQAQEDEEHQRREMQYARLMEEFDQLKREQQQQNRRIAELKAKYRATLAENANLRKRCEAAESEQSRLQQENSTIRGALSQIKIQYEGLKRAYLILVNRGEDNDVVLYPGLDSVGYEKKVKALEEKIDKLQEKLGEETVSLSVIAEGLKEYAEEAGIGPAHDLFNHLNNLLMTVPAWTKNVPQLKRFFRDFNKKNGNRDISLTGDYSNYIEIKK